MYVNLKHILLRSRTSAFLFGSYFGEFSSTLKKEIIFHYYAIDLKISINITFILNRRYHSLKFRYRVLRDRVESSINVYKSALRHE